MKAFKILPAMLAILFLAAGCNPVYIGYHPGIVITHKKVIYEPEYRDEGRYDDYYDEYEEEDIVETRSEIWIGTTILVGGVHCHWCDFCTIWHPRCIIAYCYCAPIVTHHYGYYRHRQYFDHCYDWTYDSYYVPQVSRYRFKSDGRYHSYRVERKKRQFVKKGSANLSSERIRYRGKDENRYTSVPEKVSKNSKNTTGQERAGTSIRKNKSRTNRRSQQATTIKKGIQTEKRHTAQSRRVTKSRSAIAKTGRGSASKPTVKVKGRSKSSSNNRSSHSHSKVSTKTQKSDSKGRNKKSSGRRTARKKRGKN